MIRPRLEPADLSKAKNLALRVELAWGKYEAAEERLENEATLATLEEQAMQAEDQLLALVPAAEARRLRNEAWRSIHHREGQAA